MRFIIKLFTMFCVLFTCYFCYKRRPVNITEPSAGMYCMQIKDLDDNTTGPKLCVTRDTGAGFSQRLSKLAELSK